VDGQHRRAQGIIEDVTRAGCDLVGAEDHDLLALQTAEPVDELARAAAGVLADDKEALNPTADTDQVGLRRFNRVGLGDGQHAAVVAARTKLLAHGLRRLCGRTGAGFIDDGDVHSFAHRLRPRTACPGLGGGLL
jgi:hypothetical protein